MLSVFSSFSGVTCIVGTLGACLFFSVETFEDSFSFSSSLKAGSAAALFETDTKGLSFDEDSQRTESDFWFSVADAAGFSLTAILGGDAVSFASVLSALMSMRSAPFVGFSV